jgi:hypothetical protein
MPLLRQENNEQEIYKIIHKRKCADNTNYMPFMPNETGLLKTRTFSFFLKGFFKITLLQKTLRQKHYKKEQTQKYNYKQYRCDPKGKKQEQINGHSLTSCTSCP